jgi:hypothetical protein
MSAALNLDSQRWRIIWVWLACLIISLGLLFFVDVSQYISLDSPPEGWREPIRKLYMDLLAMYASPLTTMFAIAFARKRVPMPRRNSSSHFAVAMLLSLLWNGIMVAQISRMSLLHALDIQSLAESISILPGALSFLVTPALAFYFTREQS